MAGNSSPVSQNRMMMSIGMFSDHPDSIAVESFLREGDDAALASVFIHFIFAILFHLFAFCPVNSSQRLTARSQYSGLFSIA